MPNVGALDADAVCRKDLYDGSYFVFGRYASSPLSIWQFVWYLLQAIFVPNSICSTIETILWDQH